VAANINRVVLVGNLTRDPEVRQTPSGTSVCSLRIAVNSRRRDESGQWTDKPNYFSVSVFGNQAESCAQYLSKGRPVAVDGRLDWREWQTQDGQKREAVEIVAESVQFLGSRGDGEQGGANQFVPAGASSGGDADFTGADDDIPF
jgi:single-strand DNA-binding protein